MSRPVPITRPLTDAEVRAMRMLTTWEGLADDRRICGDMLLSEQYLNFCTFHDIARPLRSLPEPGSNLYRVRFDLANYGKYAHYSASTAGLTVSLDGIATTHDGMKLSIPTAIPPLTLSAPKEKK